MLHSGSHTPTWCVCCALAFVLVETYFQGRQVSASEAWTFSFDGPLRSELHPDLSEVLTCSELLRMANQYGFAAIFPAFPPTPRNAHTLGQVGAFLVRSLPTSQWQAGYQSIFNFTRGGWSHAHGLKTYHGAVWYTIATMVDAPSWNFVSEYLCPLVFMPVAVNMFEAGECVHGVGHGLVFRLLRMRSPCSEETLSQFTSLAALEDALSVCARAPGGILGQFCATGFYHAFDQKVDGRVISSNPLFPCSEMQYMHEACFTPMFLVLGTRAWRQDAIEQLLSDSGTQLCLSATMKSESHIHSCIAGLTSIYHAMTAQCASALAHCREVPMDRTSTSFCDELGQGGRYCRAQQSPLLSKISTTAVRWCSSFIHDTSSNNTYMSDVDARRYLACSVGYAGQHACPGLARVDGLNASMQAEVVASCARRGRFDLPILRRKMSWNEWAEAASLDSLQWISLNIQMISHNFHGFLLRGGCSFLHFHVNSDCWSKKIGD